MGRKNGTGRVPQRSRLIANREERRRRTSHAFSIHWPVDTPTAETIYERLKPLQEEDDIPANMKLFSGRMHCSIIQERRVRNGLARGLAAGFLIGNALSDIQSGLPGKGRENISARFTGVDVVGRDRNILVGHVRDEDGKLAQSRAVTKHVLQRMGLRLNMDNNDHITLGACENGGLTGTERRHVIHTVWEGIAGIPVTLEPAAVVHKNIAMPLSEFNLPRDPIEES